MPSSRDEIIKAVADELTLTPDAVMNALFADLRDENRLLRFDDSTAQRLIDRYNVALAQAVLLRSVYLKAEVRHERPPRYRQLFRRLKFHRLLHRVEGNMNDGYVFHIDGPLSLFSATTKYGMQVALFLPVAVVLLEFPPRSRAEMGPSPRSAAAFISTHATAWSGTGKTPECTCRPRWLRSSSGFGRLRRPGKSPKRPA